MILAKIPDSELILTLTWPASFIPACLLHVQDPRKEVGDAYRAVLGVMVVDGLDSRTVLRMKQRGLP